MSLTIYKEEFDNSYQEIFQKVLVGKDICNTRFEPVLRYGESVERVAFNIDNVRVRNTVKGSDSTIDPVTDSSELLTINLSKEAVFNIHDDEVVQSGPLNPGENIGAQVAIKVAADLDARIFYEVKNAYQAFDTGDLTTLVSTGVPITLNSTTVPQMAKRMPAKLRRGANQVLNGNMAFVGDAFALSDIEQYLMGKEIDLAASIFANGYSGKMSMGDIYCSENLTGEAWLNLSQTVSNNDTITINGVVFTFKTTLSNPAVAGEVLLGADVAATRVNLAAAINAPGTTSATFTALSAADQLIITDTLKLVATDDISATKVKIVGTGAGRMIVSEGLTHADNVWTYNFIHCYYGKKGAIDLVVQDMKEVDMREADKSRSTNVFCSYLAGLKTFADGAKKFLDVKVAA
ncbi:MAG: hypothetical protein BWY21_01391 [Parcubacteria group bacterium ADurb.Bin216]|nr:MAG: hypothetical protein BWY21_01391 [Parcubacteria group bacterium ADurb.Bin216]